MKKTRIETDLVNPKLSRYPQHDEKVQASGARPVNRRPGRAG
jgi:hypothetical protein